MICVGYFALILYMDGRWLQRPARNCLLPAYVRLACVQRRLVCSVGVSPTGVRARGPVAWIAVRRETDWSEAYRQSHRKDGERVSGPQHVRTDRLPREVQGPMAEPKQAGRRQQGLTHLAGASGPIGGVTPAARRHRTHQATGEARLVPERKPLEGALSYNRRTREIDRRRAGGGGVRTSDDAG